jgi:hypothetical protein
MPGTYSQLLFHIAFSTKHRERWIAPNVADRLYPYMGGIVRAENGVLYDIGGIEDHVCMYLHVSAMENGREHFRPHAHRQSALFKVGSRIF